MNTVSMALPPPTSNSHLMVPSPDTVSLISGGATTCATAAELVTQRGRQVGHAAEVGLALAVNPAEKLNRTEALFSQTVAICRQPVEIEVEKIRRGHAPEGLPAAAEISGCGC